MLTLSDFLLYLAAGRLLTWLLQINGLLRPVWHSHRLLTELSECDLCLGFWVYVALAAGSGLRWAGWWYPLDVITLAAIAALMAHLLRLGWQVKFGITVLD